MLVELVELRQMGDATVAAAARLSRAPPPPLPSPPLSR